MPFIAFGTLYFPSVYSVLYPESVIGFKWNAKSQVLGVIMSQRGP